MCRFDIVEVIGSSPTNPTCTASLANAGFAVFCLTKNITNLCLHTTKSGKMSRPLSGDKQFAPDIRKFCFIVEGHRSKKYRAFMNEVTLFVRTGKNKHRHACESPAMLMAYLDARGRVVTVARLSF